MKITVKIIIIFLFVLIILIGLTFVLSGFKKNVPSETNNSSQEQTQKTAPASPQKAAEIVEPISHAKDRVTKKPFGIYITPSNSPIQPERFTGYHTGTDFEVTNAELTQVIAVSALCEGKILIKQWVSGYGGVIIQSCNINNEAVTVLYGHLDINGSNIPAVGSSITAGEHLATLGAAYSHDTDGERKHLHVGIHKGTEIDYSGYVQNKNELSSWIDAMTLL
ncbi:MAG: M23 family metallopeptidase [Patescibacteria group bacterium]|jgi:Na+-transporting methylmalonyl-CoA/oxaloacetate decarboxylase gamma subunit|nr:M23 family metallopeptidase [Patescibacteria group bacterium]